MAKTIYPLDYILKLMLDGKVQEGTQALSDYVEDQKQKRGKAGRAGSKEKKSEAAKRRWERRGLESYQHVDNGPDQSIIGRGPDSVPLGEENHIGSGGAVPASEMQAMKSAHDVLFGGKPPPGVMSGAEPIASMPVVAGQVVTRKELSALSDAALAKLGVMRGSEMEGRG